MRARRSVVQALLTTVGGCLYFLGFVGFGLTPLIAVCLVPPLFAIRDATPRRAFGLGLLLGWVTNLGGYYWVIHLLDNFTGLDLRRALPRDADDQAYALRVVSSDPPRLRVLGKAPVGVQCGVYSLLEKLGVEAWRRLMAP